MAYISRRLMVIILYVTIKRALTETPISVVTDKHCITNSSSAMSFITPIEETDTKIQYISEIFPKSYSYLPTRDGFVDNLWINDTWSYQFSIEKNITKVITDWRWEEFPIYKTDCSEARGPRLQVTKVHIDLKENSFEIPISIRIKEEAHIFLCDGDIFYSRCYWVMLQAWRGSKSALRKCGPGDISPENNNYPRPPCYNLLVEIEHDGKNNILSEKLWSHFNIRKENKVISVTSNNKELMTYYDAEPFSPKNVFFHSKTSTGLWKLHTHSYAYCTEETTTMLLYLPRTESEDCISMFIVMCSECRLRFQLFYSSEHILYDSTFTTKDEKWREIKLLINGTMFNLATTLSVTTIAGKTPDFFWAIDRIQACKENEYRILHSPGENLPCQIVETGSILKTDKEVVSTLDTKCPKNTFGTGCIPCRITGKSDCSYFEKYCEAFDGDKISCFCVPEYYSNTYTVPSKIRALQVSYKSSTTIILNWQKPNTGTCSITHYSIEYKLIAGRDCINKSITPKYSTLDVRNTSAELNHLNPYSVYEIKVFAVNKGGRGAFCTLKTETEAADNILEDEVPRIINKSVGDFNVTIYLKKLECNKIRGPIYLNVTLKCQSERCNQIHADYILSYTSVSPIMTVRELPAYTNYSLIMKIARTLTNWTNAKTITYHFLTKPSVPKHVNNFEVTSKDENSISLRWSPPYPPTGILKQYRVVYRPQSWGYSYMSYDENIEVSPCKLWTNYHCAKIKNNITENFQYYIEVWATNEIPWKFVKVTETILVTAKAEVPQCPYDLSTVWTENNDLLITWTHPNVTNGLLKKYQINIESDNRSRTFDINIDSEDDYNLTYSHQVNETELDLLPCSEFKLLVTAHNRYFKSDPVTIKDWVPPLVPPNIANGEVKTTSRGQTLTIIVPYPNYNKQLKAGTNNQLYMFISTSADETKILNELSDLNKFFRKPQNSPFQTLYSKLVLRTYQERLPLTFKVGNGSGTNDDSDNLSSSFPLQLGKEYIIYLFYVNECHGKVRMKNATKTIHISGELNDDDDDKSIYALTSLILLVPLIGCAYLYIKKKKKAPSEPSAVFEQSPEREQADKMPSVDKKSPKVNKVKPTIKPQGLRPVHSKPVKLHHYESYLKKAIQNGELERQYGLFPRGQTENWSYGTLKDNRSKNRYNNIIAYDHTRVKLRQIAGVECSDYINANYIIGYKSEKAYIATQAPKATTMNDFWRMIWENNVTTIVMLANIYEGGTKIVEQYWPDANEEKNFNGILVQLVSTEIFANYEHRLFNVCVNNEQRKVEQLHFTSWPSHGIPRYSESLVPLLQKMLKTPNRADSPIVVHCSVGVGQTGTFILCDICLKMAAGEGSVDFLATLGRLRSQRPNMVDTSEQYKFAHLVVLNCLFVMLTSTVCHDDMDEKSENMLSKRKIQSVMRYLHENSWQDSAIEAMWEVDELIYTYPDKNRFQRIVPECRRVVLQAHSPKDEESCYINAVYVDGFCSLDRFIVTQQPMPSTVGDFWRLVSEKKSTVIISLNEINLNDSTSAPFWPEWGEEIRPAKYLQVVHASTKAFCGYQLIIVRLINKRENENLLVNIFSLKKWKPFDVLPSSIQEFLTFWEESFALSKQTDPVIVTCHDGTTASGLYVAVSFLLEKIKHEQECDVYLAVRNVRHSRKQFITSQEQLEFLYKVAVIYLKNFQPYITVA